MNSLYVNAQQADLDLLTVVKYCQPLPLNVVENDKELFPQERPIMVTAQGTQLRGVKTIATYVAGLSHPQLLGKTDVEKALVEQWLTFSTTLVRPALESKVLKNIREFIRALNDALQTRTFLAANHMTVADLLIWANLNAYMQKLTKAQRFEICNVTRWYDLIQHLPSIPVGDSTLPFIAIEKDGDPNVKAAAPAEAQPKEKKDKKAGGAPAAASASAAAPAAPATGGDTAPKKEKKEKKEKQPAATAAAAAAPPADDDSVPPIAKLDLRVGKIVEVKRHENADALYVEQIDVGEDKPRTVVSGLVKFIPIEKMQDQFVIVLGNLEPRAMRGVTSHAMVMCATSVDGATVEFLRPPTGSKPGDRVYFDGYDPKPEAVLNPKKKIFEAVQPDFITTDDKVATWKGVPFRTSLGVITVESVIKGSIK